MSEDEYNQFILGVCRGDNDRLIEKFTDEFRRTTLRDWPDKIKVLTTAASIKDFKSVGEYLKVLQVAYDKLP